MVWAAIFFAGEHWLWPAVGFLAFAVLMLWLSYRRSVGQPRLRLACLGLKVLGLAALALCLLEPYWSSQKPQPGANYFLVLADNTQGLTIKDAGQSQSRGEQLQSVLLGPQSGWLTELADTFKVRHYLFDTRLQASRHFDGLDFSGRASGLQTALRAARERHENRPVAGILLFTDGNATDWTDPGPSLENYPPIYPVLLGRDSAVNDISIQKVAVTQTAFEDAPVTIQAEISAIGFAGAKLNLALWSVPRPPGTDNLSTNLTAASITPALVEEQQQTVSQTDERLHFRFQVRPQQSGISFFQLRVRPETVGGLAESAVQTREATLANNQRILVVDRGQGPYRILYVSGRPNWEFKFLNRALIDDHQVRLVALMRIARREPKFEFRTRQGESSNPLFRGFDRKDEETERYDQPVLIRFNTLDAQELRGGFPKTEEELFSYHAIILDDLEAEFFTRDQMSLVHRFVSERGGGLLMLGGPDSFQAGGYQDTPIGKILPVYLDKDFAEPPSAHLTWNFTREGWLQPWARLRNNETQERLRLRELPAFQVLNPVESVKPGAMVVAEVTDLAGTRYPALAVQRYGDGRTAALMIGDVWRWGFREASMQSDMAQAWRQMVRWMVADVPQFLDLEALPDEDDPSQTTRLLVRARDKSYRPLDNAQADIQVQFVHVPEIHPPSALAANPDVGGAGTGTNDALAASQAAVILPATASPKEAGLYTSSYIPRRTGGYLATAKVTDAQGVKVGETLAGWTSDPSAEEFKSLKPNRALLETLAARTGGRMIELDGLSELAKQLPQEKAPIMQAWSYPLWHQAWVLLFALGCFVAEWSLRRWNGLA